ncbi:MFS transporter [Streptomyces sp. NPDC088350]|uniref:MFS transporter n=1 Tax=Streptomyces sp. NPDC088350 TaxID=3365854 RepID=UPI00382F1E62
MVVPSRSVGRPTTTSAAGQRSSWHSRLRCTCGKPEIGARSRRRTGALTWGLFQDGDEPGRFIENYLAGSWAEHLARHHHRGNAHTSSGV